MNTPETINIEKYINALNNFLWSDNTYYAGDLDVDAIVEVIMTAKKLDDMVKKLTKENESLKADIKYLEAEYDHVYEQAEADIHGNIADGGTSCHWCMDKTRDDTVRKMQEKIRTKSEYGTINISPWQLDQIAKEMLEENNGIH